MITVQIEKFRDFMVEFDLLCHEHWEEIEGNKDIVPLSPNYKQYLALDEMNILCCSTAREDGKLIGYCVNMVMPHMHFSETIWALNDLLFVKKTKRKKLTGIKLLKTAMNEMKKRNVKIFHMAAKIEYDLKPLMDRLGFTAIETVYEKVL